MNPNPKTVLLITNIPTPYRIPLFNELNRQLSDAGFRLKVVFGAWTYPRRQWEVPKESCFFEYTVLPSSNPPGSSKSGRFSYGGLASVISVEKPHIIITNGFSLATAKLWLRSLYRNTRYLIWSGAIHRSDKPDSLAARAYRRLLVKRASGYIAYGQLAKKYVESLGADSSKVEIAINTVDTEYFASHSQNTGQEPKPPVPFRFLCVGQLEPRKRIDLLLEATRILAQGRRDFVVELVGDGESRKTLEKQARDLGIIDCIEFTGFLQRNGIATRLSHANAFIFPTGFDIWGLVLVEAMSAGLPCLSSIRAGATHDLIDDGTNGIAIDFEDKERTARKMAWIIDNPKDAWLMGRRAADTIRSRVTIPNSAAGFVQACLKLDQSNTTD